MLNLFRRRRPMGSDAPLADTRPRVPPSEGAEREIYTDPRESFFWTLPYKLTPQQCLNMLRAALAGDLFQQFNLCQLMLDTWPTFRKAAHELLEAAAYGRYVVHPYAEDGEKPSESARLKADVVSRAIRGMAPNPFNDEVGFSGMVYKLCDALLNGISVVELIWELRPNSKGKLEWMPRAAAWVHPRLYTFGTDGYLRFYQSDDWARVAMYRWVEENGQIPDETKFICAQFMSRPGSSLGAGFMRPLVWYWAARQFNNEWMLNVAKNFGAPFLDVVYKPGTVNTAPGGDLDALDAMLRNAAANRRLIHPEGTTINIHQPAQMSSENPQRVLEEKADEACLFLLLGQKGTTLSVPGQLGNQDVQDQVRLERVYGVMQWLARNPLRQFARAVLRRNFGEVSECPNIEADTTKPLRPEQIGPLVTSLSMSGLPIRLDELYRKIGFTMPDKGELIFAQGNITTMPSFEEMHKQQEMQQERSSGREVVEGQGEERGELQAREPEFVDREPEFGDTVVVGRNGYEEKAVSGR